MIITNPSNGRSFLVRIVFKGDSYGRDDCLVHMHDEPLLEFYSRWNASYGDHVRQIGHGFGPRGQFCSRYTCGTLAHHKVGQGLMLHGDIPEWNVDASALEPVIAMACALLDGLVPKYPGEMYTSYIVSPGRIGP